MPDLPEYQLDRLFDAPREMVWRAWTDPKILPRWYGPGAETIVHEFNLRPGGVWLGEMKWGDKSMFSKVIFQEVTVPKQMIWHHCSTDSEWNVVANPMMPDWPRVLLTTVSFDDMGGQTNVRLHQVPIKASTAEIACFASMMRGMDKGWGSGYAIIDELLEEMKAE